MYGDWNYLSGRVRVRQKQLNIHKQTPAPSGQQPVGCLAICVLYLALYGLAGFVGMFVLGRETGKNGIKSTDQCAKSHCSIAEGELVIGRV